MSSFYTAPQAFSIRSVVYQNSVAALQFSNYPSGSVISNTQKKTHTHTPHRKMELEEYVVRSRDTPSSPSPAGSADSSRSVSPLPYALNKRLEALGTSRHEGGPIITNSSGNKTFILPQIVQFGFHDVCSDQIKIANNGQRAEKKDPSLHYAHGVAYSALPLKGTAEFEVEMTDYGTGWSGTLKLGIAKCKSGGTVPASKIPRYTPEAADHCVWSSDKVHNRLCSTQKQEKPYGKMDLDTLREGDRLGLRLSHDGMLTFFVNGKCQGVAAEKIYEKGHDVYVVVDHYANCKATSITRAGNNNVCVIYISFMWVPCSVKGTWNRPNCVINTLFLKLNGGVLLLLKMP